MSQSEDQRYKNLSDWYLELDNTVLHLNSQKFVFGEVMKIIGNNPKLSGQGNHFFDYLKGWYEHSVAMGIRRLVDPSPDTRSYLMFLKKVKKENCLISRARYKQQHVDGYFLESHADRCFDDLVGEGNDCISQSAVRRDMHSLIESARTVKEYADVRIAHFNPNQPAPLVKHTHVEEALQALEMVHKKYHLIFKGSTLDSTTPAILYDWEEIFDIPWIMPKG
jgi:hypothetical protein